MTTDVFAIEDDALLGGRYELGELLGRGGMADVRVAHDRILGRDVAIKTLRNPADPSHRGRFISEARTLAGLSHPHIVGLLDAGLDDAFPYLVMELAPGRTLSESTRTGALDPAFVASVGAQVAQALCHAHAAGIVHRDVKPSNIIVSPDGLARLADFGIAKLIGETDPHTRTDETVGSPAYLSPEQVTGTEVTTAIDVYSLGLVLLEALTGRRAYAGTPVEAAVARLRTPPLLPTSLGPTWCSLLDRMTRLDPTQRPDAGHVAATLALLTGGPAAAVPAEVDATGTHTWSFVADLPEPEEGLAPRVPAPRWARRITVGAVAAGTTAAVLALGVVLTAPAPTTAAEPGTPVPDWSGRIVDDLFVTLAPVAEDAPPATRTDTSPAPATKAGPASRKDVAPGQDKKKSERPGKGKPGKPRSR